MKTLPQAEPHLSENEAEEVFGWILDGETSEEEIARFLVAITERSETAGEIAGAARALRTIAGSCRELGLSMRSPFRPSRETSSAESADSGTAATRLNTIGTSQSDINPASKPAKSTSPRRVSIQWNLINVVIG